MWGAEYYRIVAYVGDGDIYCPDCWKCDTDEEESNAAITEAELDSAFSSKEDLEDGVVCGGCHKYIREPEEAEEVENE